MKNFSWKSFGSSFGYLIGWYVILTSIIPGKEAFHWELSRIVNLVMGIGITALAIYLIRLKIKTKNSQGKVRIIESCKMFGFLFFFPGIIGESQLLYREPGWESLFINSMVVGLISFVISIILSIIWNKSVIKDNPKINQ